MDLVLSIETGDPDDIFALALLATHPRANLVAVTVYPGGPDQIGLVRHVLSRLDRTSVPIGAGTPKKQCARVGTFYRRWLGAFEDSTADGTAVETIRDALQAHPEAQLVTGAALTDVALAAKEVTPFFRSWTCQGGFAGDNIMPPVLRLPKFANRLTCPTYNLGGNPQASLELVNGPAIALRRFVPKSICHGILFTPEVISTLDYQQHAGLELIKEGMQCYFKKHPEGKALHDILAAAIAIDPGIAFWSPVELYANKNEWGCRPAVGNVSLIAIHIDMGALIGTLQC